MARGTGLGRGGAPGTRRGGRDLARHAGGKGRAAPDVRAETGPHAGLRRRARRAGAGERVGPRRGRDRGARRAVSRRHAVGRASRRARPRPGRRERAMAGGGERAGRGRDAAQRGGHRAGHAMGVPWPRRGGGESRDRWAGAAASERGRAPSPRATRGGAPWPPWPRTEITATGAEAAPSRGKKGRGGREREDQGSPWAASGEPGWGRGGRVRWGGEGSCARGLGKGEGEADFGGGWRVGPTRRGSGGSNRPRRARHARRGKAAGPRGARGRPRLGRRASPRRGRGGELGRARGRWLGHQEAGPKYKKGGFLFYFLFAPKTLD
jgi:hypothetical protein